MNLGITLSTSKYAAVDLPPVGFRHEMPCIDGLLSNNAAPKPLLVFRFSVYIIDYHPIR